jgi:8-oxo-dGTP diphosphatase
MKRVEVAAGVIYNPQGQILIAKRGANQHQGGLWEFPGGKIEAGEYAQQALTRELQEELAISVTASEPLIRIEHEYSDKSVVLDVWCVTAFSGQARGVEGQPLEWVLPSDLKNYDFPAANEPIIEAVLKREARG